MLNALSRYFEESATIDFFQIAIYRDDIQEKLEIIPAL